MALSLSDLKKVRATEPPRVLVYGVQGVGKTMLGIEAPNPVFLQIEEGTPGGVEITGFQDLDSFDKVMETFSALYTEDHNFKTVVIDTVDALEPLIFEKTCQLNGWPNIEKPGYGQGYANADQQWREYLEAISALRRDKNMMIIQIAHCVSDKFDDPVIGNYSRYTPNIHKRGSMLLQNEADMILFVDYAKQIVEKDGAFGKTSTHAEGGGQRLIYTQERPGAIAKNRYSIPSVLPYNQGKTWGLMSAYCEGLKTIIDEVEKEKK